MANVIEIVLDAKDNASKTVSGFQDALGGLGNIAGGAVSFALGGVLTKALDAVGGGLNAVLTESIEAEKVQAELAAVLKSTGGQAGVTADMANDLAGSLSKVTTFSDDAILEGENMLLTFTKIGKDVFPQATEAMLDLATKFGSVDAASIQLGKALNDPIAGITALGRAGVTFSDEQQAMIKSFMESGDIASAQGVILSEISTQVGSLARAMGETTAGKLEIFKNSLLNVAESIGNSLLPIGHTLIETFLVPALPVIEGLGNAVATFFEAIVSGQNPLSSLAILIGNIGSAFGMTDAESQNLTRSVMTFLNDGKARFEEFKTIAQPAIDALRTGFEQVINSVVPFIQNTLLPAIQKISGTVQVELPSAQNVFQTVINAIVSIIQGVVNFITSVLIPTLTNVVNWVVTNWPKIQATIQTVMTSVQNIINTVMPIIQNIIQTVLNAIQVFWDAWGGTIMAVVNNMIANFKSVIQAFILAFKGDWRGFGEALRDIWDRAWENIKLLLTNAIDVFLSIDWAGVGTSIIQGIANGIANAHSFLTDAARRAAQAALEAAKGFLGINSPSTVFMGIGQNMMQGMAIGIDRSSALPTQAMQNASNQIVNNTNQYNLTIQSNANTEDVITDFRMMQTLYGGA